MLNSRGGQICLSQIFLLYIHVRSSSLKIKYFWDVCITFLWLIIQEYRKAQRKSAEVARVLLENEANVNIQDEVRDVRTRGHGALWLKSYIWSETHWLQLSKVVLYIGFPVCKYTCNSDNYIKSVITHVRIPFVVHKERSEFLIARYISALKFNISPQRKDMHEIV